MASSDPDRHWHLGEFAGANCRVQHTPFFGVGALRLCRDYLHSLGDYLHHHGYPLLVDGARAVLQSTAARAIGCMAKNHREHRLDADGRLRALGRGSLGWR